MPAHNAPLSLQELWALKKTGESSNGISKLTKTKFLTKTQRQKLEKERELKLEKLTDEGTTSVSSLSKSKPLLNHEIEEEKQSLPFAKSNQKQFQGKGYKFEWDDSEDTSGAYDLPIIERKQNSLNSFDIPYRRKAESDQLRYLHWSQKPLDKMTDRDWRIFKEDFQISVKGLHQPPMMRFWNESGVSRDILSLINVLGYKIPTPIQRASIPSALKGNDVLGIAQTGSGKTLAYIIPAISYVLELPPVGVMESPYVLILVPTRELAQQIEAEFKKFMDKIPFNVASIIGGETYDADLDRLEKGVEILVATPGRLLDILDKKILTLDKCFYLIADEADKMIDMGFEAQFLQILDHLPPGSENIFSSSTESPKRLTMMFTATMPVQISKIVQNYMINPVTVTVGDNKNGVSTVKQEAIQVPTEDEKKVVILKNILRKFPSPIVIFVNYTKMCDYLANHLTKMGYKTAIIHGGRSQSQREEAISQLKNGISNVLVATDVAARGIDIPNVSLVVNYQMSNNISEYTHRIGRTGRAGKNGTAITFWNAESDAKVLPDLKSAIMNSSISRCPDDLRKIGNDCSFSNIEN